MNTPLGYEQKFASFIQMCSEAKAKGAEEVIIASPSALGDTYEEVIESLSRLANAELRLHVVGRMRPGVSQNEETGSD